MPKPHHRESRDKVVREARNREPGQSLKTIAADFGISQSHLTNWMKIADAEDDAKPGTTAAADSRAGSRRVRLLKREHEVLRRAVASLSQANLPIKGSTRT